MSKLGAKLRAHFVALLLMFALALMVVAGAGAWGLGQTRAAANKLYGDHLLTAQVTAGLAQDLDDAYERAQTILLSATPATRVRLTRSLFTIDVPNVEVSLAALQRLHADDPPAERELVQDLVSGWARFRGLWSGGSLLAVSPNPAVVDGLLRAAFDPIEPVTDDLQNIEKHDAEIAHNRGDDAYRTSLILIGVVTAAGLLAGAMFVLFVTRRVLPRTMAPEREQADFVEALQLSADENEAEALLARHLKRRTPGAAITIFKRADHTDTLTAVTPVDGDSQLAESLPGATPRACAAIRLARPHRVAQGVDELQACQLCGTCPGVSLCTPLTVGGRVIGSVLVSRRTPLDADGERNIHASVTQAAPVLANLRNLAAAEVQASTDALTGLPNKRSGAETLKRMAAQADRTLKPLAALSIDLDHFKVINDLHGHPRGDEVLAAVGPALNSALRASDFAARNGGEEFLVLLPDTTLASAILCAERVQAALRRIPTVAGESPITASIGVAILPDDAHNPLSLVQSADRALYTAKANGRDRIETASTRSEAATTANQELSASLAPLSAQ
jgi:diguanylate cyclase (GGDEF)-like protein